MPITQYGFDWGPAKIERLAHVKGQGYVLRVYTEHDEVQIQISDKGRRVRAYKPGHGELLSEDSGPTKHPVEQQQPEN